MAFKKFSFDPEGGFLDSGYYEDTPADSREILQRQHNQTRDYINSVVERLNSKKEGESGAESIASPTIDGLAGEDVFSQIKDMKRQLVNATGGVLSDGSVDNSKLANNSVTSEKIADGNVKTEHFSADATVPFSNETKNMNGYSAEMFEPVVKSSSFGFFKERMTDIKVPDTRGKIHKGYRYYLNSDFMLMRMSMEDFTVSEYVDLNSFSQYTFCFAFDEKDDLYIAAQTYEGNNICLSVSKYANGDITFINSINIMKSPGTTVMLNDILIHENIMYAAVFQGGSYPFCYLYKIPCDEIYSLTDVAPFFSGNSGALVINRDIIIKNGDLYFNIWCLKNIDANNYTKYSWYFKSTGNGKFLVGHDNILLVDEKNLPCFVSSSKIEGLSNNSFIYDNYLYSAVCGYLFRTRLF